MPMVARCSSEVFQREMEKHLSILVHGKSLEEHIKRLKAVLEKAREINLILNKTKRVFAQNEVIYVGH